MTDSQRKILAEMTRQAAEDGHYERPEWFISTREAHTEGDESMEFSIKDATEFDTSVLETMVPHEVVDVAELNIREYHSPVNQAMRYVRDAVVQLIETGSLNRPEDRDRVVRQAALSQVPREIGELFDEVYYLKAWALDLDEQGPFDTLLDAATAALHQLYIEIIEALLDHAAQEHLDKQAGLED